MSDFTIRMEAEALGIRDLRDQLVPRQGRHFGYNDEIAPWYSPQCQFKPGVSRVLIAPMPLGLGYREPIPYRPDYHDCKARRCDQRVPNALIDASWYCKPPGLDAQQIYARLLFVNLFGTEKWEDAIRRTPCMNLYPIREPNLNELPEKVWEASVEWCQEVIDHLRPKTIICMGIEEGRSPWTALDRMYRLQNVGSHTFIGSIDAKTATIYRGGLFTAEVIGFPADLDYHSMDNLATELGTDMYTDMGWQ